MILWSGGGGSDGPAISMPGSSNPGNIREMNGNWRN